MDQHDESAMKYTLIVFEGKCCQSLEAFCEAYNRYGEQEEENAAGYDLASACALEALGSC